MRVFWAVIGLLMVGAAAWMFMTSEDRAGASSGPASSARQADSTPRSAPRATEPAEPEAQPVAPPSAPPPAAPASALAESAAPELPAKVEAPQSPSPDQTAKATLPAEAVTESNTDATAAKPDPAPAPPTPSEAAPPVAVSPTVTPPLAEATTSPQPEPAPAAATASNGQEPEPEAAEAPPAAKLPEPTLEVRPDGTTLVDGKYTIKGKGSKDDPYKVTWDHLLSAQDDYVPREGRKEIPGRIAMLNGRWVELTGYIAFPLMADTQDECLSMMNQWDGCCIGIPPTPYDAVEVRLREPVEGRERMTSYGVVRGRLIVEPQLVGGWLIGLYLMEDATLTPQTFGGFAP